MSFVNAIRDYIEFLNNLSDSVLTSSPSLTDFFLQTSFYLLNSIKYFFIYLVSFKWLRDFSLLPILVPQFSLSIFKETFFLENSGQFLFGVLEIPSVKQNLFLLGIFNSISFTLPISIIHIISIRRLIIKGIPAAIFSIGGYLFGQWIFLACIIFGLRSILVPWLTFEPFSYILGIILIFRLVYAMTEENLRELTGWNNSQYLNFFLASFLLAWCEQTSIFQYLGNLSFSSTTSLFEIFSNPQTTLNNIFYLFGIILGSVLFTCFWGVLILQLKNLFILYTPLFLSSFIQTINTGSFILAIALSLSSIPFYGLDYLTTVSLGFVSQDKIFKNTILDQYNIKDSVLGLGISSQFDSVDIDISPFDRGRYLIYPERTMPFGFEDLNYRGEFEWTTRYDKVSTVTDSRAGFLSLAKFFKKEKTNEAEKLSVNKEEKDIIFPIQSNFISDRNSFSKKIDTTNPRFDDWYTFESTISSDDSRPLESIFSELQDTSFPLDFLRTNSIEPATIDFKIKQKYYSNPLYKNLLTLDIDLFLNRQLKAARLTPSQEIDLYTKRKMLTFYYDSLRDYTKLPYSSSFEGFFNGSKSFSNKVYNQQFKGTLRSVCRLFALTTDNEANVSSNTLVLKYDQPLYTFPTKAEFDPYHEEINLKNPTLSQAARKVKTVPFLTDFMSAPLYAGWDENLRKLIITNKFLPRDVAGYSTRINEFDQKYFSRNSLKNENNLTKTIQFTVWPLSEKILRKTKNEISFPYTTLYTSQAEFEAPGDPRFETLSTLPGNWETRNRRSNIGLGKTYENIFDYLAPQRGGFIWPGTSKPNFHFTKE